MLKNKQKNMKTRSCRMRDLNSSGSTLGSIWGIQIQSPPYNPGTATSIQSPPYNPGTATSPDFKNVIGGDYPPPTRFKALTYAQQETRKMFDRRIPDFINVNAYLFNAEYSDDLNLNGSNIEVRSKIEVQVNPEFEFIKAKEYAEQYAKVIGRLPKALRRYVQTVWIHKGDKPFGGGNNNLLIHVEQGDNYIRDGILEEILIHEACHTSLDYYAYSNKKDWESAQIKDKDKYISTYAHDNPAREDIAESFLAYFAVTYRKDLISDNTYKKITSTIPNRIKFFDSLNLDMSPYVKPPQT
jgi:hypothetical protein